jgi:hypothetical protein
MSQLKTEPLCRFCLDAGDRVRATVADHVERHNGNEDMFWSGRLQSLCKLHHDSSKQKQERRGCTIGCGLDGWPLDDCSNSGRIQPPGGTVNAMRVGVEDRMGEFVRTVAKLKRVL